MRIRCATRAMAGPRRCDGCGCAASTATSSSSPSPAAPLDVRAPARPPAAAPRRGFRVSRAPRPRVAVHSSPVASSQTNPNSDVRHRRPVGDRDRDGVRRESALGVHRAVDRVDHDAHRAAAEVDLAALLRHRDEAGTGRVAGARAPRRRCPRPPCRSPSVLSPPSPWPTTTARSRGARAAHRASSAPRRRSAGTPRASPAPPRNRPSGES